MRSSFKIGERRVGDGEAIFLVLDIAHTGGGDPARARTLVAEAGRAGFNAVVFHLVRPDEYAVPPAAGERGASAAFRRTIERERLAFGEIVKLAEAARKKGLAIIAQPYDLSSVNDARTLEPDALLLEASALVEEELLFKAASLQKPMLLKAGGATAAEVEAGLGALRKAKRKEFALVQGFAPWLPAPERMDLKLITTLAALYGGPVGYAETAAWGDLRACNRPVAAVALGARLLFRSAGPDAAEPCPGCSAGDALDAFVRLVRAVESDLGSPYLWSLNEDELRYRETTRKKTVAARDLKRGEIITFRDFVYKMSDAGVSPDLSGIVIGRRALCDIAKDQGITPEMFMEL